MGLSRCIDRRLDVAAFHVDSHRTMWFGSRPDTPGSRIPGAGAPRVATIVHLTDRGRRWGWAPRVSLVQAMEELRRGLTTRA